MIVFFWKQILAKNRRRTNASRLTSAFETIDKSSLENSLAKYVTHLPRTTNLKYGTESPGRPVKSARETARDGIPPIMWVRVESSRKYPENRKWRSFVRFRERGLRTQSALRGMLQSLTHDSRIFMSNKENESI